MNECHAARAPGSVINPASAYTRASVSERIQPPTLTILSSRKSAQLLSLMASASLSEAQRLRLGALASARIATTSDDSVLSSGGKVSRHALAIRLGQRKSEHRAMSSRYSAIEYVFPAWA